jgi:hypothetical protein
VPPVNGVSADSNDATGTDTEGNSGVVGGIKKKAHQLLGAFSTSDSAATASPPDDTQIPEKLASLVLASRASDDAKIVEAEINRIQSGHTPDGRDELNGGARDVARETEIMRGYKKATYWTQFKLLSGRAFKNLYRNPLLMATHYVVAIVVALLCGFFFYGITNDIPGFQ